MTSSDGTVQIILLVLQSESRRFELLQLEFDSRALVNEILAQIPDAATEDVLRNQAYSGICSVNGNELHPEAKLGQCVERQNEVKVAVPADISAAECVEIAGPILSDAKVKAMLDDAMGGQDDDISGKKSSREKKRPKRKKKKREEDSSQRRSRRERRAVESMSATESEAEGLLPVRHVSAVDRFTSIISGTAIPGQAIVERKVKAFIDHVYMEDSTIGEHKASHIVMFCALLGILISIASTNLHLTMALRRGSSMRRGEFLRKCGVKALFGESLSGCSEMSAVLDYNRVLSVYQLGSLFGRRQLLYKVQAEHPKGMTDDGLVVQIDGTITIGGVGVIVDVPYYTHELPEVSLSPWPFMQEFEMVSKRKNFWGKRVYKPVAKRG